MEYQEVLVLKKQLAEAKESIERLEDKLRYANIKSIIRTQRNELIDKAFNRFKTQTAGYDD